jgi:hypothetical protein
VRLAFKEFFNRSQFFWVRAGFPSKPHAQSSARRSNARRNLIEAQIRVFNELPESCDQRLFAGFFPFLGACSKTHKSVSSEIDGWVALPMPAIRICTDSFAQKFKVRQAYIVPDGARCATEMGPKFADVFKDANDTET